MTPNSCSTSVLLPIPNCLSFDSESKYPGDGSSPGLLLGQHRTMGAAGFGGPFAPSVQLTKMGNTQSIPAFPELSAGSKFLAKSPCPIMRCCLRRFSCLSAALFRGPYTRRRQPAWRKNGWNLVLRWQSRRWRCRLPGYIFLRRDNRPGVLHRQCNR